MLPRVQRARMCEPRVLVAGLYVVIIACMMSFVACG
jgi:hypothetical protein